MIYLIDSHETYQIRLDILRKGKKIKDVIFNDDKSKGSFHLGYFHESEIHGVISGVLAKFPFDKTLENTFQLRGMAVYDEFKNKRIGSKLIQKFEKIVLCMNSSFIWCNARISAIIFYEKQGFKKIGEIFNIDTLSKQVFGKNNID